MSDTHPVLNMPIEFITDRHAQDFYHWAVIETAVTNELQPARHSPETLKRIADKKAELLLLFPLPVAA